MQLLKPGTVFGGRYEIVRTLSAGGMGMVYEILHRDTKRRRAIKVMLPQMLANEEMRERFKREGLVTAGIESEHLVEVFDVGVDEETQAPFMVMELLRGEDLGARLSRRERTPPAELFEIVEQVVRGLERTHAAGIVHRDLKPENLFVTHRDDGSKRVKILDFGIAKLVDQKSKATATIGTPLYMAPEQMTGESHAIGPATDLYSLGHIVFTLLVGRPYFHVESEAAASALVFMFRVSNGSVEPASKRGKDHGTLLPEAFDAWFKRATHLDPTQRFQSGAAFLNALREALAGSPEELPTTSSNARVIAFQPTQPVSLGAHDQDQGAPSSALTPALTEERRQPEVSSHTSPVPSTRTVAQPSVALTARPWLWVGAAVVGAGIAAALMLTKDAAPPSSSDARADSAVAASRTEPPVHTPDVTLALASSSPEPSSPPVAVVDPMPSAPTASAAIASAQPSVAPAPASAAPAVTPKQRWTASAKPSAPPPSTGPASTVWQGPRR